MSTTPLDTNFKDDILASSNAKRKYQMTYNDDGTVSFQDATAYSQMGSAFGAKEVNEERAAINKINSDRIVTLDEIDLVTEPGFFVDAMAVKELNRNLSEGFSPLTSDSNGIYRHPSGLMLQWGIYPSAAMTKNDGVGGYLGKIKFKESFAGTPQCFTTCHYWGGNTQTGTQDISSASVTLYSKSAATDLGVRWLALGSWK